MGTQFVIDCGSRSIKLHEALPGGVSLAATRSWDPINDAQNVERVGALLADLTRGVPPVSTIHVIGTAAARRDQRVATAIGAACSALGWSYETLSHQAEAGLILEAFGGRSDRDIVNAGGGSIQIVQPSGDPALLQFGITDLNNRFALGQTPRQRLIGEAIDFVSSSLPVMPRPFIYSGGELSYLLALGAVVDAEGRCTADEFFRIAERVNAMELDELEQSSPFDAGWIRGAVASNCIVAACLTRSGRDHYFASDINIADGIISGLIGRKSHAAHAGF